MTEERQSRITQITEIEDDEEGDVLELTDDQEIVEEDDDGGTKVEDDQGEVFVQIGDEEPPAAEEAPEWVKQLRKTTREQAKRIKELEARDAGNDNTPKLGVKPTMESCDYDAADYERKLEEWHEQKRAHDAAEAEVETKKQREAERWQAKIAKLNEDKAALGIDNIEEVEEVVRETFNVTQQGIIVQGAKNAALVFAALGQNEAKANELAAIEDPIEFAFAVARLETQMKPGRRNVPPPEGKPNLGSRPGNITDNTLDKLRQKAAKTGDYTEVAQYKRQQRAKAKA